VTRSVNCVAISSLLELNLFKPRRTVWFPFLFCLSRAGRCLTVWSADCVSPPTSSNLIKACSSSLSNNLFSFLVLSPSILAVSSALQSPRCTRFWGEDFENENVNNSGEPRGEGKDAERFHWVTLLSGDFNCFWFILMQNREREREIQIWRGGSLLPCFCLVLLSQALSAFTGMKDFVTEQH